MKITPALSALLLSSVLGFAQAPDPPPSPMSPPVPGAGALGEALNQNYVIRVQVIRDATNLVEIKMLTARRSFKIELDKPRFSFSGKLNLVGDEKACLHYELSAASPGEEPEKKGAKSHSQSTNQMINSGLFSFIFKSPLNYGPYQNQVINEGTNAARKTSLQAAVLLRLGQPMTIMRTGNEVYQLCVDKLSDGGN